MIGDKICHSPALISLELVCSAKDVAKPASWAQVQEALRLERSTYTNIPIMAPEMGAVLRAPNQLFYFVWFFSRYL